MASFFEERARRIYHDTVVVIDADGGYLGNYRKMHLPDDPGFYEKFYFTPGDLGYKVCEARYAKIGTLICWDQCLPEAAGLTAMMGADILCYLSDPLDENYRPLQENFKALTKMKLISGRPLRVHTLPMPQPKFNQGQRLPASYANFYICNTSVLVPTYNDPNDQQALSILAGLFSNRKVVGIDASELIRGLGSLHCLCMQEPLI